MKRKFQFFLHAVIAMTAIGCSSALMAQTTSGSDDYFVDHESIQPGHQLVTPYSIPGAQTYLECYQEGGAPNEAKALATVTWNYKGKASGALIDGNKTYGRVV